LTGPCLCGCAGVLILPSTDAAVPPRHAGKNHVAFLDGSVKAVVKVD
jgi:prepilin-type processing-associated H-X9-DG protein